MEERETNSGNTAREVKGWAIASNFAFTVAGGCLIGWLLQHYLWPSTAPWLLLGGALLGLVSGSMRFVKEAIAVNREAGRKK